MRAVSAVPVGGPACRRPGGDARRKRFTGEIFSTETTLSSRRCRESPATNQPSAPRVRYHTLCLPLICPIGSRRSPEVFVMEPTHAGHLHHIALARRLHTPWLGCVLGQ
jgi:hypothetical protein